MNEVRQMNIIRVIPTATLTSPDYPTDKFSVGMAHWLDGLKTRQHSCLLCNFKWKTGDRQQEAPAAFVFFNLEEDEGTGLSAVCAACYQLPGPVFKERLSAAAQKVHPGLELEHVDLETGEAMLAAEQETKQ